MVAENKLKAFLDEKAEYYCQRWFVTNDPISIPHQYSKKEDIEISAFLTATLSWGKRSEIIKKSSLLMQLMENQPFSFITEASLNEFNRFGSFVYRTFNGYDCLYFISALREIYIHHGGLENAFLKEYGQNSVKNAIIGFRKLFLSFEPLKRTGKHVADVSKNASAKRINMFLRWMVRNDKAVDFGIWDKMKPANLMIPLDVHVGRVARTLGLLSRQQDDWKAVEELTANLRLLRPDDPVYYDYALFGIGVYEDH